MNSYALLLSARAGFAALQSNLLRTTLSALGVIIGVGAIISVLAMSDGFERTMRAQIARDGRLQSVSIAPRTEDMVDGQPIPRSTYARLTAQDAASLAASLGDSADVYMGATTPALVALEGSTKTRGVALAGTLSNAPRRTNQSLLAGRFFDDNEVRDSARVAVLSHPLAAALIDSGGNVESLVGRTLTMYGETWSVVGVMRVDSQPQGPRRDRLSMHVPVTSAQHIFESAARPVTPQMVIVSRRVEDIVGVRANAERWLANRFPDWKKDISVASYQQEAEQLRTALTLFKLLMGAITGVS